MTRKVPPQAITAAAAAIHDVDCTDDRCSGSALGYCHKLARAAVEAAAPHLAAAERADAAKAVKISVAAERELCAQLAEQHGVRYLKIEPVATGSGYLPGCSVQPFADLLRKDHHAST